MDVNSFDYALDRNAVLHIRAEHGDVATEKRRGQRGVMEIDCARLPDVLSEPDKVSGAGATWKSGRSAVLIRKIIDSDEYNTVWEVRTGRKMLVLQSLWIVSRKTP